MRRDLPYLHVYCLSPSIRGQMFALNKIVIILDIYQRNCSFFCIFQITDYMRPCLFADVEDKPMFLGLVGSLSTTFTLFMASLINIILHALSIQNPKAVEQYQYCRVANMSKILLQHWGLESRILVKRNASMFHISLELRICCEYNASNRTDIHSCANHFHYQIRTSPNHRRMANFIYVEDSERASPGLLMSSTGPSWTRVEPDMPSFKNNGAKPIQ